MSRACIPTALVIGLLVSGLAGADDAVVLKSRRFVPPAGLSEALRSRTQEAVRVAGVGQNQPAGAAGMDSRNMHVIVQLESIPTTDQRAAYARAGVQLLSYLPHRAWLASAPADKLADVAQWPEVRAVTELRPQDKLAPAIREQGINSYSNNAAGEARLVAVWFSDVSLEAGEAAVMDLGGRIVTRDPAQNILVFYLPVGAAAALAAQDGVKWIDQHYESVDLNDGVRAAIEVNAVQAAPYGLTGVGVVLGQWESKHPDDTHDDLTGRVVNIQDNWPVGDHATQVAGTMIGDGRRLQSRQYRGMATAATIVSFHSWDNVVDLRGQYKQAIEEHGIDIANNSWGKVEWNVYKDYDGVLDGIVRGELGKPVSMVWAVGNEGGWGTILCTAVAKNVVTVGATNSDDGSLWPWSNKGPTDDRRIKPDVVSPGCEKRVGGTIWSTIPGNSYGGACGTSLAAPSVSGTLALVLEQWRRTHAADPLPSTLKGILLHSATDLGELGPDYAHGYGLINARRAADLVQADMLDEVIVEGALQQSGQRDLYTINVGLDATSLKATLVWDDFPADPLTAHALVNDLDLVVMGPNGRQYYPWTLDPYVPQKAAERTWGDHTNNVEQVYVENPARGTWQVVVLATSLPQGHQKYSLLTDPPGFAVVSPGASILSIAGHLGQTVAQFDDRGNLILAGSLTTATECFPLAGAFVIRGPQQDVAGHIDLDGNMCIRGDLHELSDCTVAGGGFVVKNWFGGTVALLDGAGNLCLAGRLRQNARP